MAINPKLQTELDKCYLTFLINIVEIETQGFKYPIPPDFTIELGQLFKKLWPGLTPTQYLNLITKTLEDHVKIKEGKHEEQSKGT